MAEEKIKIEKSAKKPSKKNKPDKKDEKPEEIVKMELENRIGFPIRQLEKEMECGFRHADLGELGKFKIYLPTPGVLQEINIYKTKQIGKLIQDKSIVTRDQVIKTLKERGIWGEEETRKDKDFTEDVIELTKEIMILRHANDIDPAKLTEIQERREKIQEGQRELCANRDFLLSGTLEAQVEEEALQLQLVLCVKKEDDTYVWKDLDEFKGESNRLLVSRLSTKAGLFWNGWVEDLLGEAPGEF